jgi:hypothetical protein
MQTSQNVMHNLWKYKSELKKSDLLCGRQIQRTILSTTSRNDRFSPSARATLIRGDELNKIAVKFARKMFGKALKKLLKK